jgi:hypothetical protein
MDTKFRKLYYYIFVSNSWIDCQIRKAIEAKEVFNERRAAKEVSDSSGFDLSEFDELEAALEAKWNAELVGV